MSRRHREQEKNDNEPQQAESQGDGRLERTRVRIRNFIPFKGIITKRDGTKDRFSLGKIASAISKAFSTAFEKDEIEVDEQWVKIPLKYFDEETIIEEMEKKSKGGRNPIKRLFDRISDSKAVQYFHDTLDAVKEKCVELYENITQYCTCFLKAANKVFSPDDDPYGKVSHYHRILELGVPELPTRKTLNNWLKWFEDWRPAVTYEDHKAKKERARHRLWEKLIEWIQSYLFELAPQYAFI